MEARIMERGYYSTCIMIYLNCVGNDYLVGVNEINFNSPCQLKNETDTLNNYHIKY